MYNSVYNPVYNKTSENLSREKLVKSHNDDIAVGDNTVLYTNSGKTPQIIAQNKYFLSDCIFPIAILFLNLNLCSESPIKSIIF